MWNFLGEREWRLKRWERLIDIVLSTFHDVSELMHRASFTDVPCDFYPHHVYIQATSCTTNMLYYHLWIPHSSLFMSINRVWLVPSPFSLLFLSIIFNISQYFHLCDTILFLRMSLKISFISNLWDISKSPCRLILFFTLPIKIFYIK